MSPDKVSEIEHEEPHDERGEQGLRRRIHWMCAQARGVNLLDVGCGQGVLPILLAREGYQALGVDLDPDAIARAEAERQKETADTRARLRFRSSSIFDCNFEESSFDTIYLGEILEHTAHPERLVELVVGWTKPEGRLVITTLFDVLADRAERRTFGLRSFIELVDPLLIPVELVMMGEQICYTGEPRNGWATRDAESPGLREGEAEDWAQELEARLGESESRLAEKERYILLLQKELQEVNLGARRHDGRGSQHPTSVRHRLGHALQRAARHSRDTWVLPRRVAGILAEGLKDAGQKRDQGGLLGRIARAARLTARGDRSPGQEGAEQGVSATRGSTVAPGSGFSAVTQDRALDNLPAQHAPWALDLIDWKRPASPTDVRVCAVLDEFSATCFRPECSLVQPRPDNWESVAAYEHPRLLFVESAWKGNEGAWQYRVARYASPPGQELADMVERFRREGLPTVFWNKEDPVHFDQFVDAARRFDVIFTSDENQVAHYRSVAGHDRVEAMGFAAQPRIHNPIARSEPRNHRACFAGSYYANRFGERREEMVMLLDAAAPFGLDIYDRNHGLTGPGAEDFRFPTRFDPYIRGRLTYSETLHAYKRYRVFLNVNSVIDSPTMFSRRVFELLACGTPVVSTRSRGIEETLGSDAVWLVRDGREAAEALEALLRDDSEWLRRSLAGIRRVFAQHTYHKRFQQVLRLADVPVEPRPDPVVLFFARVGDGAELRRVQSQFERQTYTRAHLAILCARELAGQVKRGDCIHAVTGDSEEAALQLTDLLTETGAGLVGLLTGFCVYGRHYAEDLVWAHTYSGAPVVGKALSDESWYRYHQKVHPAGCLVDLDALRSQGGDATSLLNGAQPADWLRAGIQTFCADGTSFVADFAAAADEEQQLRARDACEV
ncbi:MAG: glycosyltransferase [bacterium]